MTIRTGRPPRLLVRTLGTTLLTVFALLVIVFAIVSMRARSQVRESVTASLESTQRIFAALETRRLAELRAQAATLAENPTLKAAVDTYAAELNARDHDGSTERQLLATIQLELQKVAERLTSDADAIVLVDSHRKTLAAAGPGAGMWPPERLVHVDGGTDRGGTEGLTNSNDQVFRLLTVPLLLDDGTQVGTLCVATSLDQRFAQSMKTLFRNEIAILRNGLLLTSTLTPDRAREFELRAGRDAAYGTVSFTSGMFAYQRLVQVGDAAFYALSSIDEATRSTQAGIGRDLIMTAAGAMLLALLSSAGLALQISRPIRTLAQSIQRVAAAEGHPVLPHTGSSRELDALVDTFNDLIGSVKAAEAETQAAYMGAIRALAVALDARDPYTAGHSERVSVLSVAVARQLELDDDTVEIVRLGALLHDIGKIGISDEVLRKPGPLTEAEFDAIKMHTVLGARILESVPFLTRHVPIVELHHERPDGKGYPHGLCGDDIPLPARIVHVADAYDAITSARAYRAARPSVDALRELWRYAGTEFDAEIVGALAASLPALTSDPHPESFEPADTRRQRMEAIA